jgi:hypothetical protein
MKVHNSLFNLWATMPDSLQHVTPAWEKAKGVITLQLLLLQKTSVKVSIMLLLQT